MSLHSMDGIVIAGFEWALRTSFSTIVLIGLVFALHWLFRRLLSPRWLYILWLCVLARLIMPGAPAAPFSIFNLWASPNDRPAVHSTIAPSANVPFIPEAATGNEAKMAGDHQIEKLRGFSLLELAPLVWLAGTAAYLLLILACHRKLSISVKLQQPLSDPRLICMIEEARSMLKLRRTVRVFESPRLKSPSLFGFFKPRLLIPRTVREMLTDHELRLVILHELIHLKRNDVALNWVVIFVQALHWFNPFVWLAIRLLRSARELLCDATVLSYLNPDERRSYGATLIKLAAGFSRASLTPSLVPIISHKNETHRRITMIAKFKPSTRTVTIASAILVLTLACLTFTAATEKAPPAAAAEAEKPPMVSEPPFEKEAAQRRIAILEKLLDEQTLLVRDRQAQLDKMQQLLGISQLEDAGQSGATPDLTRKMEILRLEAKAEASGTEALYTHLSKLTRSEFKRSVSTASPDAMLVTLLSQLSTTEQKLTELRVKFSTEHPDVKSTRSLLEKIQTQINDRLDGVLEGLKVKVSSQQARLDQFEKEIAKARNVDIDMAIARRPYFQAKRDLENLQVIRERLQSRLAEEKINAAVGNNGLRAE